MWDALHGNAIDAPSDVDVVWFDATNAAREHDAGVEAHLRGAHPHAGWDVKNQARMHVHNGVAAYRDIQAAIACWPETATAVAVRAHAVRLELVAPHGIADLLGLIVRPTPAFVHDAGVVARRVRDKGWRVRWPGCRSWSKKFSRRGGTGLNRAQTADEELSPRFVPGLSDFGSRLGI